SPNGRPNPRRREVARGAGAGDGPSVAASRRRRRGHPRRDDPRPRSDGTERAGAGRPDLHRGGEAGVVTGSLPRRYARALLGLARDAGALEGAGEELASAAATLAEPALRQVVLNPGIAAEARRAVVGKTIEQLGLSKIVGNLVRLLADRDRLEILSDVSRA